MPTLLWYTRRMVNNGSFSIKLRPVLLWCFRKQQENAFALVNTVADNEKNYSKKYVKKSYKVRNFQQTISNVSTKTLLQIVDTRELKNCPITTEHVRVAEDILGPNIQSLQVKTSRKTPSAVDPPKVSSLPNFIELKYVNVILCADIMFVNGVQFLWLSPDTSVSGHLSISPMQRQPL